MKRFESCISLLFLKQQFITLEFSQVMEGKTIPRLITGRPLRLTMPVELRKAHQDNDRAVMQAYGFDVKTMTESQCVAELFKLYQECSHIPHTC